MTRKVYAEVEQTVLVPVRVKTGIIVRIDDGVSFEHHVKRLLTGKGSNRADLEDMDLEEVVDVNGCPNLEGFEAGVEESFCTPGTQIHSLKVTDSK
jgi:hypothetical protein